MSYLNIEQDTNYGGDIYISSLFHDQRQTISNYLQACSIFIKDHV